MDDRSRAQITLDLLEPLDRPVQDTVEYAFEDDDPDIIEELLNRGMSPNIKTKYGNLLQSAIWHVNPDVVQLLIEHNVDPFKMDEAEDMLHYLAGWNRVLGHMTPLEIAKSEGYDEIVELLSNYIRIIMIQRNRRRKLRNRRIRTLKSRQRLALSRGMEDRDSIFGSIRYEPSLLESISNHLSRIRLTDI
tara:strand:- start:25 stop:594 length:570 start_codon:yes stop_codon:yes gene_type:complete